MAYKCEILADSISEQGHRLTTFKLTYPRIIHAEMLRHRMLSRNVASSRAIPFEKMVKDVEKDPFIPIAWQKHHKGMQGTEYFTSDVDIKSCRKQWLDARDDAVLHSSFMYHDGTTKQLVNRLLEPFVWTTELVSGTEWENFFSLRCPKYRIKDKLFRSKKDALYYKDSVDTTNKFTRFSDLEWLQINESQAEIHIQKIAEMMWDTMNESVPKELKPGEWHIPFGDNIDLSNSYFDKYKVENGPALSNNACNWLKTQVATARAARISYTTLGDNPKIDYEADIKLHDRLLESKHLSCFEHCARVMTKEEYAGFHLSQGNNDPFDAKGEDIYGVCGNYRGFIQYRYLIENE